MKRVVIDARMVGSVMHGIARYVSLLAQGLQIARSDEGSLPYEPVFLVASGGGGPDGFHGWPTVEVDTPFLSPIEQWVLPRVLREADASLYHSPSFSSLLRCPCPRVMTVHDLIHLEYGGCKERLYYRTLVRPFARGARAVMTVSQASRAEVEKWLGSGAPPVTVVFNALDPQLQSPAERAGMDQLLESMGLARECYFVCLSNPKPHKNVALLIDSYEIYRREAADSALPLVLSLAGFEGRRGVISRPGMDDGTSRSLLSASAGLLFPSLREGFGLPPVEAAVLGVPMAVSRIDALREGLEGVPDSEVAWIAPRDVSGWVSAFHRLQRGEVGRPGAVTRSRLMDRFSTRRLGAAVDRVYRHVLAV